MHVNVNTSLSTGAVAMTCDGESSATPLSHVCQLSYCQAYIICIDGGRLSRASRDSSKQLAARGLAGCLLLEMASGLFVSIIAAHTGACRAPSRVFQGWRGSKARSLACPWTHLQDISGVPLTVPGTVQDQNTRVTPMALYPRTCSRWRPEY